MIGGTVVRGACLAFITATLEMAGAKSAMAEATTSPVAAYARLDAIVQEGIEEKHYPGAVLIIGRNGDIHYQKAYGKHTFEPDAQPMTMETTYQNDSRESNRGVTKARREIIETILRSQPEYSDYYASLPAE